MFYFFFFFTVYIHFHSVRSKRPAAAVLVVAPGTQAVYFFFDRRSRFSLSFRFCAVVVPKRGIGPNVFNYGRRRSCGLGDRYFIQQWTVPTQRKRANGTRSPGLRIDRPAVITAAVSAVTGPRLSGRRAERVWFAFDNRRRFGFRAAGPCGGSLLPLFADAVVMPLLHRKPFAKNPVPRGLRDTDEVFFCRATKEIFLNYEWVKPRVCGVYAIVESQNGYGGLWTGAGRTRWHRIFTAREFHMAARDRFYSRRARPRSFFLLFSPTILVYPPNFFVQFI